MCNLKRNENSDWEVRAKSKKRQRGDSDVSLEEVGLWRMPYGPGLAT